MNGQLKKGVFILAIVFVLFVAVLVRLYGVLAATLEQSNQAGAPNINLSDMVTTEGFWVIWFVVGLFALVWLYSVIDAFLLGGKMGKHEQEDGP